MPGAGARKDSILDPLARVKSYLLIMVFQAYLPSSMAGQIAFTPRTSERRAEVRRGAVVEI